jgi:hypothetical protein
MSTEILATPLSTADLVAAVQAPPAAREPHPSPDPAATATAADGEALAPLFVPAQALGFRTAWDAVQIGFVDDPRQAVRQADELVAQVMKTLAESFASQRTRLETQVDQGDPGSTEDLRVALRRYRSFFQRLLAL